MKNASKLAAALGVACMLLLSLRSSPSMAQASSDSRAARPLAPIKIGVITWIGQAPLYLAKQAHFWDKRGLNVSIERIQGGSERIAALRSGQTQAAALALDAWARFLNLGTDAQIVLALNESKGADGIVARNDIRDVRDFKGKKVAFQSGISSEFLLGEALKKAGLTSHDIKPVDLDGGAAGAAFVAHRVDVAVTFEPWLSKAEAAGGHVVVSSADFPGLIVDAVGFSSNFIAKHPESVKAFVAGYFDAVNYMQTHPAQASDVMSQFAGLTRSEFDVQAQGVHFYRPDELRAYFDPSGQPNILTAYQEGANFWKAAGQIASIKPATKVINGSFLQK